MMKRIIPALLVGFFASYLHAGDKDIVRIEYPLKVPRSRDPVLGGARDKVYFSVWIPPGVKTVRGAMCNPFSKGDTASGYWQAMGKLWQFAYVQTDFDAVKKDEFGLLKTLRFH